MKAYDGFATLYDIMQYDVDYAFWASTFFEKIKTLNKGAKRALELGCGTATLSLLLSEQGLQMDGLDVSDEMLAIAQNKAKANGVKMQFFCQDMRELHLKKVYDAVIAPCDGFNYLTSLDELESVFVQVSKHLEAKGVFIFDLSSIYKFENVIGDRTFAETFDESAYIWENEYDSDTQCLKFLLTLFKREGGHYHRMEEYHEQFGYEVQDVISVLSSYFDCLEILDGDSFTPLKNESERICFICQKKE